MQYIFIQDLRVDTIVGVYDHERDAAQTLRFDVEAGIPDGRAFVSDRLADTVDYAGVAALIQRELRDHRHILLERLAGHLCDAIEREYDVAWIRMRIAKPGAVPGAAEVGIFIERGVSAAPSFHSMQGMTHDAGR